ncbi:ABC transporter ATP-binding protein [Dethiothermospora halolimnae]|uniref:ABC transporter ATP-binding protein n=1 Tax=Dethiothermospora halolimnae TaxID=3114390 RepID=UPI003CCC34DA
MVSGQNIKKYYEVGENIVKALDGVNISIKKGEIVSIIGSSGSGKTTLLNILGGLDKPTEGEVLIEDRNIHSMTKDDLAIFRRRNIGFIFQSYNLLPVLTAWENIILPLELDHKNVDREYIEDLMMTLQIYDRRNHLPGELSGGQQQRVAIARALASKPLILLADEPTGNVDSETEQEILKLLKFSVKKYNQTLVMITHSSVVANMADRIIKIEDGRLIV